MVGTWSVLSGGVILGLALVAGITGIPDSYKPVIEVLPELLAPLTVLLAWRYRRSRLLVGAAILVVVSLLVKGPLESALVSGEGLPLAAFRVLLPLNLLLLVLMRDRSVTHPATILHVVAVAAQPFLVSRLLSVFDPSQQPVLVQSMMTPQVSLLVFLVVALVAGLALAMRRGAFDFGLVWVLVDCAVVAYGGFEVDTVSLILAAAQLTWLLGMIEEAYRLAYHDQLTGLPGRRAFDSALQHLTGTYTIAMADVDRFKRFNDRFGHDAGDQALRMVADVLRGVRGGGRAFRYGGEEFVIIFSDAGIEDTREHLEVIRQEIASRNFGVRSVNRPRAKPDKPKPPKQPGRFVKVTISIGVAGPDARKTTAPDVLRAADRAMYRAKKAGRNRLVG